MRKIFTALIIFLVVGGMADAVARGGRGSDDCPPKSTDPDCK